MIEFILLGVIAFICFAISAKPNADTDVKMSDKAKDPGKNLQSAEQTATPLAETKVSDSVDDLALDKDFDIYDLMNAGKD